MRSQKKTSSFSSNPQRKETIFAYSLGAQRSGKRHRERARREEEEAFLKKREQDKRQTLLRSLLSATCSPLPLSVSNRKTQMNPLPSSPRLAAGHEPSPGLRRSGGDVNGGSSLPSPAAPTSLIVAFSPGSSAAAAATSVGGSTALLVLPSNPAPAPRPPSPPPGVPQPSRGARPNFSTSEFRGVTKHK